jgi:transcriptional regulator with XRE-family HTH domain
VTTDPLSRLLPTFGTLLCQQRSGRKIGVAAFASAAEVPIGELELIERGHLSPTLPEFFRLARALGKEPTLLLIDLISEWRADPRDALQESRPSDFVRLYRLGYYHKPGDFREQERTYTSDAEAIRAADKLSQLRAARLGIVRYGLPLCPPWAH